MKTENSPLKIREITDAIRMKGKTVGFVPTMGALHEGHLKLVEEASSATDFTVVSIFVNPTQFGPNEDFDKYPRTIEEDLLKLKKMNVDLVFIPTVKDMYGDGALTVVSVNKITDGLCGAKRENHFDGVATVVLKLFNIIGECSAFFGKKDYQQLQVIKQMVKDLNVPVRITGVETVRESDGLAKSSRNNYLSAEERVRALCLYKAISEAQTLFKQNIKYKELKTRVEQIIKKEADKIDYIEFTNPKTLQPHKDETLPENLLLAIAAYIGKTRLIDNKVLSK